ncbi:bacteriohemerythrin [Ottowia oryzae]|uniref:Hemerythrin n=1 Tax=Ottowia oryzae TaxID=2109914 RepID=A0A2S0MFN1_9BURK|nr:hemerythrin domain-containing protein [Ottowia oryzae]AVO34627.1 hemerythrin [Ottowia oryzae]
MTSPSIEIADELHWRDDFLLGHAPLDDMHREFVEVVSALQAADDAALPAALARVTEHLVAHFEQENAWMQSTAYPATECHLNEHAAVLASAQAMPARLAAGETQTCRRFAQELASWFPGHADYLDAPLAHWMVHKRFGAGKPVVIKRRGA